MATKDLVLFESSDGEVSLPVPTDGETVWLSQAQMAELFGKERTVVAKHIKNAINEWEIDPKVVCANFAHTTRHGALSDRVILRRAGSLSVRTGEGCKSAVSRDEESRFFGWQQAHCRRAIPLLPLAQHADVPQGWFKAHRRSYARRPHAHDRRIPPRGEGNDGQSRDDFFCVIVCLYMR